MFDEEKPKKAKRYYKIRREILESVLKDIEEGSHNKHAAQSNGLSETHFYILLKQGEEDLKMYKKDTLASWFLMNLRNIEKKEIKKCRKLVIENEKGHDGAKWTLEHAYWRYYSKNAPAKDLSREIEMMQMQQEIKEWSKNDKIECKET